MEIITLLGLMAAAMTTSSFVPQVVKTWKLRETKDISLMMYFTISIGLFLWLIYGISIRDVPIVVANGITVVLSSIILGFKVRYG